MLKFKVVKNVVFFSMVEDEEKTDTMTYQRIKFLILVFKYPIGDSYVVESTSKYLIRKTK